MRAIATGILLIWLGLFPAFGQELSALARLDAAASSLSGQDGAVTLDLAISQAVPWRVRLLDGPPRMILDVREVDWTGIGTLPSDVPGVLGLRAGVFRTGWSRLVVELDGPFVVSRSEMQTRDTGARIRLTLIRAANADFAAAAAVPEPPDWAAPKAADLPEPLVEGAGPLVVVLDPGHGGIDPGAERDGKTEAALMLTFARELKDLLLRDGRFAVVMTRDDDVFVPLEARISIARAARADVLLSLHADALAEGEAQGATIYTLSADASDEAAAALAERHDRDDLLAGVDLSAQDDLVTEVLIDMARTETAPRIARLARALEAAIRAAEVRMHRQPLQEAGFSVLKSPDIPSVLLELGFLSSSRDLKRLEDPAWRATMAEAVRLALLAWSEEDAALRAVRKE